MRATAHYVEELDSPISPETQRPAAAVETKPAPAAAPNVDVSSELERSLSALGVCTHLLGDSAPALARVAAATLIRAEVWRALCLVQASRVLRDDVIIRRDPIAAAGLVERVLSSVEPERRLRGVALDRQVNVSPRRVAADEELLVSALSGVFLVAFGLLDGVTHPRVRVTARADGDFLFTVALDGCRVPAVWMTDTVASATSDPAGDRRTILFPAARRIVERCEGRVAVTPSDRGSEIIVSIPCLPD